MRLIRFVTLFALCLALASACSKKPSEENRKAILEVEGKFLYEDEIAKIIPPNVSDSDSIDIVQSYMKKWATDVLLYENAKRNISNKAEIDDLVEAYRKTLVIHQYQQKLIEQRMPKDPSEDELKKVYDEYTDQLTLKESILKGLMLIVPANAPKIANVRSWVQSGDTKALENIEKYSIQNAVSYDYFADRWMPFSEIMRKMPLQVSDPASFLSSRRFVEVSDSTQRYFLRIESYRNPGQTEPFEMAKSRIANMLINKHKADFISNFEKDLYDDAVKNGTINYLK